MLLSMRNQKINENIPFTVCCGLFVFMPRPPKFTMKSNLQCDDIGKWEALGR